MQRGGARSRYNPHRQRIQRHRSDADGPSAPRLVPPARRLTSPQGWEIFESFRPTPRWGAEQPAILFQAIDTRLRMIGLTLQDLSRMQMDQAMQEFASSRRIGQQWGDVLAGVARWKDSTTSSEGTAP